MAKLQIPSNVKCITSGQVPTTEKLKDGEFAFGKVGGVAKLYGNVNGVIIDFTGDSGGGSEYTNTSEIVDANLTLTSSSTLTDMVNGMSAEKTKVIRVNNDNAAYTQVRRILDNPETGGPPSSLCCFYFKFVSTDLIQAYYGYSSNYLSLSIIAKFPASGWGFTSWRALNAGDSIPTQLYSAGPSSTAIKVFRADENSFPSMLFSLSGNFAESYRQGIVISDSVQGERGIMIGKDNIAYVDDSGTYIYLRANNVKTLFGNQQSIYGSGNIDLYKHIVWIKNDTSGHQIYVTVHIISSSNTLIDSLTDLFSVLNSYRNAWYPCNGRVNITGYKGVAYNFQPVSDGAVAFFGTDGDEHFYTWSTHQSGLTVEDTVTTV